MSFPQSAQCLFALLLPLLLLACNGQNDAPQPANQSNGSAGGSNPATAYREVRVENGGSVAGRVLYRGSPPNLPEFEPTADQESCGGAKLNQRLKIGPGGGVAEAIVYLENVPQGKPMGELRGGGTSITQVGCTYQPHVLVVPVGAAVAVRNDDELPHNVRAERDANGAMVLNRTQPRSGVTDTLRAQAPGLIAVTCDYHPWMSAYILGVQHPYYAITDSNGAFSIADVPPGTYTLRLWHNGVMQRPKRDTEGRLVGYRYDKPTELQQRVAVEPGKNAEATFTLPEVKP
ncbi:MAG: hypothetical protein IPM61_15145 [Chlorobi bacterium]|nr:hypothetical protein [Chlorobiota bacterium]MBX7218179.1 hypothetical protein [Candidatus Kapabacteria bacterium]